MEKNQNFIQSADSINIQNQLEYKQFNITINKKIKKP